MPSQPTEKFLKEKETCLEYFHSWSEQDQIDFVEELLQVMCHYQHGTVNAFLKPMLQRDFISLLPKKGLDHVAEKIIGTKTTKLNEEVQTDSTGHQIDHAALDVGALFLSNCKISFPGAYAQNLKHRQSWGHQHLKAAYHPNIIIHILLPKVTWTPTLSAPLSLYARRGYGSSQRACCGRSSSRER